MCKWENIAMFVPPMGVCALAPGQTVLIIEIMKKQMKRKREEEPEELDWDADLEEARDYCARVSVHMTRPRQPPEVLLFQSQRPPAGWPAGVWLELPPKPDLVPKNKYGDKKKRKSVNIWS